MKRKCIKRSWLAALAAGLLCAAAMAPAALHAQTASFAGVQTPVPASGLNDPTGVAVDGAGDVFIADTSNSRVVEVTALGVQTTVPASGLTYPTGVAVDSAGDVFIADLYNRRVVEVTPNGVQTNVPTSGLLSPFGVAVDGSGDVFISDIGNDDVLEVTPGGVQYTVAGTLILPYGVAADGAGDVFIADYGRNRVMKMTPDGVRTMVPASGLSGPRGVAVDAAGNLFIADTGNSRVVEVTPAGVQTTVAASGSSNPPYAVAVDSLGSVYVAYRDFGNVLKVQPGAVNFDAVSIGSKSNAISLTFDFGAAGTIAAPAVLTLGSSGLDFADAGTGSCTVAGANGTSFNAGDTCTVDVTFTPKFAGLRQGAVNLLNSSGATIATAYVYGKGTGPQIAFSPAAQSTIAGGLSYPNGVAVDGAGDVFIADTFNSRVVEATPLGVLTTIGSGLSFPYGVAVDGAGDVFIADNNNNRIVKVTSGGDQTTVPASGLSVPYAVAVDGAGDVLIADTGNSRVVKVTPLGVQTTIGSGLSYPFGVAVDGAGDVFIADAGNSRLVEVTPLGVQTTVPATGLSTPFGVAVDGAGDVFIADNNNNDGVVEVTPGGVQTTLPASGLSAPSGMALDGAGDLFIADTFNNRVVKLNRSTPPALAFATTPVGQTSSDSPKSVTVQNIGNASLSLTGLSIAANFGQVDGSGNPEDCTASLSLAASASCNLSLSFTPTAVGTIQGSAVLSDNALNANPATQTIALSGMATQATQTVNFTGLPLTATFGSAGPYTLNGTASSGLAVSYSVAGPANVIGNTLTITGPGTVIVTASQAGNGNYSAAVPVSQTIIVSAPVSPYDAAISVQYASTQLVYPGATNITVCIAPAHNITATGSVQIFDGNTLLATISVQGGGCAYWYISPGFAAGSHVLTAVYSGDKNNPAGTSAPTTISVAPVPVKLAPACWLTNTGYGANYQCTVSASSNAGSAQGVITYSYDGASPVSVQVNNGTANFTLTRPAAGNHSVVIAYAQQTNYAAAGPITENFTVSPAAVNVSLTPSSWYTSASAGISFAATVNSSSAGAPNSNGSVEFLDGNTLLATVPVNSNGQASYSSTTLAAGPHTITATYSGGVNYASGSSSVSITLTK